MEFVAAVSHELRTPVAVIDRRRRTSSTASSARRASSATGAAPDRSAPARRDGRARAALRRASNRAGASPLASRSSPTDHRGRDRSSLPLLDASEDVQVHATIAMDLPPVLGDADGAAIRRAEPDRQRGQVRRTRSLGRHPRRARSASAATPRCASPSAITASASRATDLPHIFEPFYRGADAVARQIHGNGLGLCSSNASSTAHGGASAVTTGRAPAARSPSPARRRPRCLARRAVASELQTTPVAAAGISRA